MNSYLTIARDGEVTLEIKRSRFLCTLRRVETEAAARGVVEEMRTLHWDARHHCSAFVIGADRMLQRSNDDGEPSGTAGAPMLEVLRGHGVSDVVVVVTRWFGGILLGAGGLVRAYGDAVTAGLVEVGTLQRRQLQEWSLVVDHADAGRIESELRDRGVRVLATDYEARVRLLLGVGDGGVLQAAVAALTSGRGDLTRVGERWIDVKG